MQARHLLLLLRPLLHQVKVTVEANTKQIVNLEHWNTGTWLIWKLIVLCLCNWVQLLLYEHVTGRIYNLTVSL